VVSPSPSGVGRRRLPIRRLSDSLVNLRAGHRPFRHAWLLAVLAALLTGRILAATPAQSRQSATLSTPSEVVNVDATAMGRPFPHSWEKMFGSGRAILTLRDSYRRDLREVKQATDFDYVRFHAIFHDEVGVYDESDDHRPTYNYAYVDQIYDGLLENRVRPFVELSFMPRKLAAQPLLHAFWYKPVVAPPRDWSAWGALITSFVSHLIDRYGIDEVSRWYFEVWNEPNIDFWAGDPKEATYYQLYDTTVAALKAVNPRLRVGGPATAQAAWVDRFIRHTADHKVPVDFVSTHVYANDTAQDVFGTTETISRSDMVVRAIQKVHDQIRGSARPDLPLFWTEYNASYKNEPEVTDAAYMGPWLAHTISQSDGLTEMLSYWALSDVFEEQGVVKEPFYGGYGLMAEGGVPKPAFNAFKLLHRLGSRRIPTSSSSALVTRRDDGSWSVAVWNLGQPGEAGTARNVDIRFAGWKGAGQATVSRVDAAHGSALPAYQAMGRPVSPTRQQWQSLRQAASLGAGQTQSIEDGHLLVSLPPDGLALVEIR
jgi:xylan 1,4-beta-xylosidase